MSELFKALVTAQGIAQAVEKDSKNAHHNYKYASAEAIIEESREALTKAGLSLITLGWKPLDCPGRAPRVEVTYLLAHASGEAREFTSSSPVIPGQGRPEDKAEFGALTENLGYFLRGLLLLPRVDEDVSVSGRNDSKYVPAQQQPRPPAARPAPAAPPAQPAATAAMHPDAAQLVQMTASVKTPEQTAQVATMLAAIVDSIPVPDAETAFAALAEKCGTLDGLNAVCALVPAIRTGSKSAAYGALRGVYDKRVKALKAGVGVGA